MKSTDILRGDTVRLVDPSRYGAPEGERYVVKDVVFRRGRKTPWVELGGPSGIFGMVKPSDLRPA